MLVHYRPVERAQELQRWSSVLWEIVYCWSMLCSGFLVTSNVFSLRNGMFTASQLSNFSLLLHYLCTTQTLFGDNPPIAFLDGSTGSFNSQGGVTSVLQFHQSFIDYCIRLKLANLLYQYLDFYRYGTHISCLFWLKSLDILTLCSY